MTSLEESIVLELRQLLEGLTIGVDIPQSEKLRTILTRLERYLPNVLRQRHPEWKYESLDGILPVLARKTGPGEAEMAGDCILISDQTLTPIHLRIQVADGENEINWLECRLGERDHGTMKRASYDWKNALFGRCIDTAADLDSIDWFYGVTFGRRRGP